MKRKEQERVNALRRYDGSLPGVALFNHIRIYVRHSADASEACVQLTVTSRGPSAEAVHSMSRHTPVHTTKWRR